MLTLSDNSLKLEHRAG